jgi:hypothetical protein
LTRGASAARVTAQLHLPGDGGVGPGRPDLLDRPQRRSPGTGMLACPTLSDEQVWQLALYLRRFAN